jgi:hypothetical protein
MSLILTLALSGYVNYLLKSAVAKGAASPIVITP